MRALNPSAASPCCWLVSCQIRLSFVMLKQYAWGCAQEHKVFWWKTRFMGPASSALGSLKASEGSYFYHASPAPRLPSGLSPTSAPSATTVCDLRVADRRGTCPSPRPSRWLERVGYLAGPTPTATRARVSLKYTKMGPQPGLLWCERVVRPPIRPANHHAADVPRPT